MANIAGLQLEFSDGGRLRETLANFNEALAVVGASISPLDVCDAPADVRKLLAQGALSADENARLREHFLLSREQLLEVIASAGRRPHVAGGGELCTRDATHDCSYPQLWSAQQGANFGRFDRFHVNAADDGTGVDEVCQLLAGGGLRVLLRMPTGGFVTLVLDCPSPDAGWLLTYDGARPHIGSLSQAQPGTKALVQVIGPAEWQMRYTDRS